MIKKENAVVVALLVGFSCQFLIRFPIVNADDYRHSCKTAIQENVHGREPSRNKVADLQ